MRTSVSRGRTAPTILLGPGHTDKRIRFCDTILGKVLRYSFAESLSIAWSHCDRTSAEYHGANEDSLL